MWARSVYENPWLRGGCVWTMVWQLLQFQKMARPRVYATDEERKAALRASWQKYNAAHKAERAAHNKAYCTREEVKAKRRERWKKNKLNCIVCRVNVVWL